MTSSASARTAAGGAAGTAPRPDRSRHVAIVIASLGPGGAERIASSLARHWVASGRRVTLVTIASRATDAYELPPEVERVALDLLRPSRSVVEGVVASARRVAGVRRALLRARPDVVVSFLERTNVVCLLAAAGTGLPVYVCERTDPRHDRAIGRAWAALRRVLYPHAAGVVVQTESVAGWARAFCSRVHVIPNFVEAPHRLASPGADHVPSTLLAVGRLSPEKGFDLLLGAFARIADRHPGWSLVILGEGPERGRLEALVRTHRLDGRVTLPGRDPDPGRHLAAAHAFVLSSRFEGFPNALLEAMACGLPAVAFACPSGPSDVIEHGRNGVLVPPEDEDELARALDRVLGDAGERARLGRNAREIAARLAPGAVLERWSALLHGPEAAR